jgi:hypothetical protein
LHGRVIEGRIVYRVMADKLTFAHPVWAAALVLCACQYVADLSPSDVSVRDDGADTADLDADAPDRDADVPDRDTADQDPSDPDVPDVTDVPDVPEDDGGETGCTSNAQCDDGQMCNGSETCDLPTGTCQPGTNWWDGYPCTDADPCTADSHCDGAGSCVAGAGACDDHLSCTADTCTAIDPTTYECDNNLRSGYCLIDWECYDDNEVNPSNACQSCYAFGWPYGWIARADGTSCTDGRCCSGACQTGASCCEDGDCPTGCSGTPVPCSNFVSGDDCSQQAGCTWESTDPPSCTGTAVACDTFSTEDCRAQEGCRIFDGVCLDYACT